MHFALMFEKKNVILAIAVLIFSLRIRYILKKMSKQAQIIHQNLYKSGSPVSVQWMNTA